MANRHVLKTPATLWDAVDAGKKRWEVRRNDRFFQVGDIVVLRKVDDHHAIEGVTSYPMPDGKYADLEFRIGWMAPGDMLFGIDLGWCVFSLDPVDPPKTLYWADMDGEWVFTEDRPELLDDLGVGVISRAIHSNVEPFMQWAVRVPIDVDDEGFVADDELRWFPTQADAQDCVDYLNGAAEELPPPVTPPSRGEGQADG